MLSGLGGMVAQGMAWGTGTALAREAVHAAFHSGSGSEQQQAAPQQAQQQFAQPTDACYSQQKAFMVSGEVPCRALEGRARSLTRPVSAGLPGV